MQCVCMVYLHPRIQFHKHPSPAATGVPPPHLRHLTILDKHPHIQLAVPTSYLNMADHRETSVDLI